jgi:hypothetical protein
MQNNMKAEINNENKSKFFALYWGQSIGFVKNDMNGWEVGKCNFIDSIELKPLSSISDEDAIEVAKICHQMDNGWEIVKRNNTEFGSVHLHRKGNVNDIYHTSITFHYAEVIANHHFLKTEDDDAVSFKVNIGKINQTEKKPVPYIAIVDYLRSKGYALPWMGLSVEEMVQAGWIKLTT